MSAAMILSLCLLPAAAGCAQQPPAAAAGAQAERLLQEGRTEEALPVLLRLHQSQPTDWRVCHQLGIAYTKLEQLEKGLGFYEKALAIRPGFLPARKNRATVLWFLNRKGESEREFLSLAKAYPRDAVPHLYLGLAEYERGNFSNAKGHFEQAGGLALNNPEVLPTVLDAYLGAGDKSVPSRLLEQLRQSQKPDPELVLRAGTVFARHKMYREAIESLEKIVSLDTVKPEVYLTLAEAYDRQGIPEKAYGCYAKAIEVSPQAEESYIALAHFASAHLNSEFALKVLDQGLQRIPGSSKLLVERGTIYALQGNPDEAEQSFRRASQADPNWNVPLLALGVSQLERGKLNEAASAFREAARIAPDDWRARYLHATALSRMGDPARQEEVIAALRNAMALNPKDPKLRASLGQAYLAAGQVNEAVLELEQALKIDPDNSTALYQLGLIYGRRGKTETSRRLLARFQEVKAREKEPESALVQILKIVRQK